MYCSCHTIPDLIIIRVWFIDCFWTIFRIVTTNYSFSNTGKIFVKIVIWFWCIILIFFSRVIFIFFFSVIFIFFSSSIFIFFSSVIFTFLPTATNNIIIPAITILMCEKAPSLVTEDSNILGVSRLYVGGYNLSNWIILSRILRSKPYKFLRLDNSILQNRIY